MVQKFKGGSFSYSTRVKPVVVSREQLGLTQKFGFTLGEWLQHRFEQELESSVWRIADTYGHELENNRSSDHLWVTPDHHIMSVWWAASQLLGGSKVFGHEVEGPLDAHAVLKRGLPSEAILRLMTEVELLQNPPIFEQALGMSKRTLQRRKDTPERPLSPEQSGRTWKFAELLTKAAAVLGSQDEAEAWLQRPALGLNSHSPLELLSTAAGVEAVEEHLGRMEYGVYA